MALDRASERIAAPGGVNSGKLLVRTSGSNSIAEFYASDGTALALKMCAKPSILSTEQLSSPAVQTMEWQ